jgi:K+-transporting ATPase ATPase C chain
MRIRSVWLNSLLLLAVLTILCGGLYPLLVTFAAQGFFRDRAAGSLLRMHGQVVGSSLLAQSFDAPGYFHARPSACGYSTLPSAASNFAPTSSALRDSMNQRRIRFIQENGLSTGTAVPPEMLCASGSGLDPHISPESAFLQLDRVVAQRRLDPVRKRKLQEQVTRMTESRQWGIFGEPRINVLKLNFMLDNAPEFRMLKQERSHEAIPFQSG